MTQWERILKKNPHKAPFTITMDASSINEVWADVDTKLGKDEAWHIVGIRYTFEGIDPVTPTLYAEPIHRVETLQLQRGNDSEVLLPAFHDDVIIHHSVGTIFFAEGAAVMYEHPYNVPCNEVTRRNYLRALFRSRNDNTGISDASIQLTGVILYHLISAPDDGRTKLGVDLDDI